MEAFPGNPNKDAREPSPEDVPGRKGVTKIVTGAATRRKKPLGKRLAETIVGGTGQGVLEYVVLEVLVPAAKDMIADAASQAIEQILFGEVRSTSRRRASSSRSSGPGGYVSYNRYSSSSSNYGSRREDPREREREMSRRGRAAHDFDEIVLDTRADAEEVIDRLFELISKYESASVADLYELVGLSAAYTDDKWGWTDFRGAGVTRVRTGYLLDLPRPVPLN